MCRTNDHFIQNRNVWDIVSLFQNLYTSSSWAMFGTVKEYCTLTQYSHGLFETPFYLF
jgi:hypothetical protein